MEARPSHLQLLYQQPLRNSGSWHKLEQPSDCFSFRQRTIPARSQPKTGEAQRQFKASFVPCPTSLPELQFAIAEDLDKYLATHSCGQKLLETEADFYIQQTF